MEPPIKILIADDHTIVRQGLARLLEDHAGFKVIGEAVNGNMAIEKSLALKPDVVIMDIAMPLLNGIEAARRIRKHLPQSKIIILSMYAHEHYIHELLEAGISGYLLKDSSGRDIIDAIQAAMKGETFLSPPISKVLVDRYLSLRKSSPREERFNQLSNREREIFQLIAEGHSTKKISQMLCISISTVKTHRQKVMEKLEVDSPAQLVHYAISLGLVEPEL
ncbi:MAG: response regulator transcription factor [Deltaproteobacteria bacterium]|nr:response regulator transcription factor [Deltaproteobacteria bacterium]